MADGPRLVLLCGPSGCGKTTWLRRIAARLQRAGHEVSRVRSTRGRIHWMPRELASWVLYDEIFAWRDLLRVRSLLRRGHQVVAANHLAPRWFGGACGRWGVRRVDLDRPHRLESWLRRLGVASSATARGEFLRRFGVSFTDLGMILEWSPGPDAASVYRTGPGLDLDVALRRFDRRCRVRTTAGAPSRTAV